MPTRLDLRLSDARPRSAARYYGFQRTAEAIGDVPITLESATRVLKAHAAAMADMASRPDPFLAFFNKRAPG